MTNMLFQPSLLGDSYFLPELQTITHTAQSWNTVRIAHNQLDETALYVFSLELITVVVDINLLTSELFDWL